MYTRLDINFSNYSSFLLIPTVSFSVLYDGECTHSDACFSITFFDILFSIGNASDPRRRSKELSLGGVHWTSYIFFKLFIIFYSYQLDSFLCSTMMNAEILMPSASITFCTILYHSLL